MRLVRGIVPLVVCLAVAPHARADDPDPDELLKAFEKKLTQTIEAASPGVACVVVSRSEFYPKVPGAEETPGKLGDFDRGAFLKNDKSPEREKLARMLNLSDPKTIPDHGYAGGVVIDAAGYILTPYHVIDGAKKVYVYLPDGKGSYADIRAADARSDLAVLKLQKPPPKLKAIKFADVRTAPQQKANVRRGTLVILMANPYATAFGMGQPSAAWGTITNVRHRTPGPADGAPAYHTEYGTLLQFDAKLLNAGVTGGALLNLDGELIGLTNAAAVAWSKEVGPGYAIPADNNFRRIVEVLRRGEEVEYGFFGMTLPPNRRLPPVVPDLTLDGPAAAAGIAVGDLITQVNGNPVENYDDVLLHVGSALAGSKVSVTVSRGGRARTVEVTLGKYRHQQKFIASVRPEPVFGLRVDFAMVWTEQRKRETRVGQGVLVREVVPDSPAAKQFKTLGDNPERWLVTHVNGVEVTTPAEFYKAARGQDKVKLSLIDPKDGTRRELTLP